MSELIALLRITPVAEAGKKWGMADWRLNEVASEPSNNLPHFVVCEKRIRPADSKIVYFCRGPYYGGFFNSFLEEYNFEDYYFNTDDVETYSAINPETTWAVMKEEPEFLPAEDVRRELGMSRNDFIDFLNDDRCDRLMTSDEECFRGYRDHNGYRGALVPYFTSEMLEGVTIERIDWENWKSRQKDRQSETQGKEPAAEYSHDNDLRGRVAELESQLAEVQAERNRLSEALEKANTRIAELETATPAYDMALQERGAQIATLQSEIETVRRIINQCGALSVVVKMLEGGSTKEGIAIFLKGEGLSYNQVGVLLHDDPLHVGESAIQQCAKRLLGVAAK